MSVIKTSNRSKKLSDGCPAKFILRQKKEISQRVLPGSAPALHSKDSCKVKADIYDVTFVIAGCLTHSHETTDTEYDRLTTRVRNNIVQLLSIGVPLIAIKDKYLSPEYFGGATGKVYYIPLISCLKISQGQARGYGISLIFSHRPKWAMISKRPP